jgi:hypothetical protein
MKTFFIAVLIFLPLSGIAKDGGDDEAIFTNKSNESMYCYGDAGETGNICQVKVKPGESCRGDGMGGDIGSQVYKAPNTTQWSCKSTKKGSISCSSQNTKSALLTAAAFAAKGFQEYYSMNWSHWVSLMGQKAIIRCNQNYKPISPIIWVPLGDETKCDLSQ